MSLLHLSKPMEWTIATVKPNVKYKLWIIIMCQCYLINYNKIDTVIGDIDYVETMYI